MKRQPIITIGFALILVGVPLFCFGFRLVLSPSAYYARAIVEVETGLDVVTKANGKRDEMAGRSGNQSLRDSQHRAADLIESETILTIVISSLKLDEKFGTTGKIDSIKLLKKKVHVSFIGKTTLIWINAISDNPDEAAHLANAVALAYVDYEKTANKFKMLSPKQSAAIIDMAVPPDTTQSLWLAGSIVIIPSTMLMVIGFYCLKVRTRAPLPKLNKQMG